MVIVSSMIMLNECIKFARPSKWQNQWGYYLLYNDHQFRIFFQIDRRCSKVSNWLIQAKNSYRPTGKAGMLRCILYNFFGVVVSLSRPDPTPNSPQKREAAWVYWCIKKTSSMLLHLFRMLISQCHNSLCSVGRIFFVLDWIQTIFTKLHTKHPKKDERTWNL